MGAALTTPKCTAPQASPDTGTPRVRGRPRAFDRAAALDKATQLFWCKGYEATSIADLTQALGIAAPSLYAAFGSKEALFAEALAHYDEVYGSRFWTHFMTANTVREAVGAYLMDTATGLTPESSDEPRGCMLALSSVGGDNQKELGGLVRAGRGDALERLKTRIAQGVADGEIPPAANVGQLARFVQAVQSGMSVVVRDGASREELFGITCVAMQGWDAQVAAAQQ